MISCAVIQRNRINATRSTGPRTPTGKTRVGRNARRHGLSLPVLADPALVPAVEALARRIAGEGANAAHHDLAMRIAEAQIDLVRIRRIRLGLTAGLVAGRCVSAQLLRIDRYEQRAWSRRQTAIDRFHAATGAGATRPAEQTQAAEQSQAAEQTQLGT